MLVILPLWVCTTIPMLYNAQTRGEAPAGNPVLRALSNSSDLATLAITAFYVDGGGLKLLHSGDSNFIAEEFETMRDKEVD